MVLRNRFLSTSSLLFNPPGDPPAGGEGDGKPTVLNEDVGAEGDSAEGETQQAAGDDGAGDDGDAGDDDGDAGDDGDEDPDLADLPPEVRAKAKAAIERKVAKETGWRDRQIDKLHRKNREKDEDVRALETIADPARRAAAAPAAGENLTEKQIEDRAKVLAGQMTAQQQYDQNANDADARGKASYGDKWGTTMAKLPKLGGVDITDMVDILNTDQPHVVLFSLADPDTYERVMALPPARRRNEYVKLSMKEAPKPRAATGESKRPSEAAPPPRTIQNGRRTAASQVDLTDDKTPDDKWYEARNATRRKKFSNHV